MSQALRIPIDSETGEVSSDNFSELIEELIDLQQVGLQEVIGKIIDNSSGWVQSDNNEDNSLVNTILTRLRTVFSPAWVKEKSTETRSDGTVRVNMGK